MKQLQNNFTNPEQSRQLLKLGLPADSADMFYSRTITTHFWDPFVIVSGSTYTMITSELSAFIFLPCWSVGRLQEIAKICAKEKEYYYTSLNTVGCQENFIEWWVKYFTLTDDVLFDFSKLED